MSEMKGIPVALFDRELTFQKSGQSEYFRNYSTPRVFNSAANFACAQVFTLDPPEILQCAVATARVGISLPETKR